MRDRRYLLTRRRYGRFVRADDAFTLKQMDELERRLEVKPKPFSNLWMALCLAAYLAVMVGAVALASHYANRRALPEPELSSYQIARDEAAQERARDFVRGLDFEPGPAVCRAKRDGSAWCTIRVAGSEKTFALWCSDEHPACIEKLPRE